MTFSSVNPSIPVPCSFSAESAFSFNSAELAVAEAARIPPSRVSEMLCNLDLMAVETRGLLGRLIEVTLENHPFVWQSPDMHPGLRQFAEALIGKSEDERGFHALVAKRLARLPWAGDKLDVSA